MVSERNFRLNLVQDSAPVTRSVFSSSYLVLPAVYLLTIFVTSSVSLRIPGAVYYRIGGICPPVAALGMAVDSGVILVGAFLMLGTPWWYLVGRIGWDGLKQRRGVLSPILGSALAALTCFISTAMTLDSLKQDIRDGVLHSTDIAQYVLIALLCIGALLSTVFAVIAAFTPSREI